MDDSINAGAANTGMNLRISVAPLCHCVILLSWAGLDANAKDGREFEPSRCLIIAHS